MNPLRIKLNSLWFKVNLNFDIPQVCGLKWSHDDRELASGGNDNQVCI